MVLYCRGLRAHRKNIGEAIVGFVCKSFSSVDITINMYNTNTGERFEYEMGLMKRKTVTDSNIDCSFVSSVTYKRNEGGFDVVIVDNKSNHDYQMYVVISCEINNGDTTYGAIEIDVRHQSGIVRRTSSLCSSDSTDSEFVRLLDDTEGHDEVSSEVDAGDLEDLLIFNEEEMMMNDDIISVTRENRIEDIEFDFDKVF